MKLSEELKWRGFYNQTTYKDLSILDDKNNPIAFYFGSDPSASSLTIGNWASIMMIKHFINAGHKAYMLIGGATGMIGDPDGKRTERELLTIEQISENKSNISEQYSRILGEDNFVMVDNYDWFKDINYLDFLRNVGKHVPMSKMLNREFVKTRLEDENAGISYAEFSYSLIQGYDFLHLYRNYGITLQLCGSDQWGNALAGVDMTRRIEGGEVDIYSAPLIINKSTGIKFGKSESGAIWLDEKLTSVYKFYQFWLNVDDLGVIDYIKIYTMLDKDEIEEIDKEHTSNNSLRIAQKRLAFEATMIVHGEYKTNIVKNISEILFSNSGPINDLTIEEINILKNELPHQEIDKKDYDILESAVQLGIIKSKREGRDFIEQGGLTEYDLINGEYKLLKRGKNTFAVISII